MNTKVCFWLCLLIMHLAIAEGTTASEVHDNQTNGSLDTRIKLLAGEFASIPEGETVVGPLEGASNDASINRSHIAHIKAFQLAKNPVTYGQFKIFTKATNYKSIGERSPDGANGCRLLDLSDNTSEFFPGYSWDNPGFIQSEKNPVVCLSWDDIQAFISWLNKETGLVYRLPTEAEWLYVAREGALSGFPTELKLNKRCERAQSVARPSGIQSSDNDNCVTGRFHSFAVRHFPPNRWGVYDMIGNVWERTADCYKQDRKNHSDGPYWPAGPCGNQVILGTSWLLNYSTMQQGFRFLGDGGLRFGYVGFRLARDIN